MKCMIYEVQDKPSTIRIDSSNELVVVCLDFK